LQRMWSDDVAESSFLTSLVKSATSITEHQISCLPSHPHSG
jgi:hypothetical protein